VWQVARFPTLWQGSTVVTTASPLERLRAQTEKYHGDKAFLARWSGLSLEDVALRTAQQRVFVELLSPVWKDLGGLSILDVGCGVARWLRWYVELGAEPARLRGVDVSDCRFDEARELNPRIELSVIDGEHLPFDDASFDLVTQWVCFMCIPTDAWRHRMAAEIDRVLRPGGYVWWWDTPKANADLTDGLPLDPAAFFPRMPVERREVRASGLPSQSLRAGLARRLAGPVLDRLAPRPTHVAARIGPRGDTPHAGPK
jgi:SAM-dependent methyltransferase